MLSPLAVRITAAKCFDFPGWVACEFTDAHGRVHAFVEKAPVVAESSFRLDGPYPRAGVIACEILSTQRDAAGQLLVRIDMSRPLGVESSGGVSVFEVRCDDLVQDRPAGRSITFAGPAGLYTITLPKVSRFEDATLAVVGPDGESEWHIEVEETDADGVFALSGMTRGKAALWFELCLGALPEVRYWSDEVLVRTDVAV